MIDKELMVNNKPISSNDKPLCARCGQPIVDANKTDWEVFVTENITQPICVFCETEESNITGKVK
jgi:hypothetical protein